MSSPFWETHVHWKQDGDLEGRSQARYSKAASFYWLSTVSDLKQAALNIENLDGERYTGEVLQDSEAENAFGQVDKKEMDLTATAI
jgi:hypothetical protein